MASTGTASPNGATQVAMPSPLRVLSLRDLEALDFPPVEWVVDDLIPAGALVLMVGRPKAGKSLLAIDMMASVAVGDTFLDRATAQGPAVYVPAEDALSLVRSRLWTRLGAERDAPFAVVPADGSLPQGVRIDDAVSFVQLAGVVDEHRPALLVLDPLRELHRKKENDADEMAELLRPLRQLAHETNTTILLIHHRNKYAIDPSLASRGSSAIVGGVDLVVTLELSGEDEKDIEEMSPHRTLKLVTEGRYGPPRRVSAQLRPGLRWQPTKQRPIEDLAVPQRVWRHLEMTGHTLTAEELADGVKAAKGSVQNALTELVKVGHARRVGSGSKGDAYRYVAAAFAEDSSQTGLRPSVTNLEFAKKPQNQANNSSQDSSFSDFGGDESDAVYAWDGAAGGEDSSQGASATWLECNDCGKARSQGGTPCPWCGGVAVVRRRGQ